MQIFDGRWSEQDYETRAEDFGIDVGTCKEVIKNLVFSCSTHFLGPIQKRMHAYSCTSIKSLWDVNRTVVAGEVDSRAGESLCLSAAKWKVLW